MINRKAFKSIMLALCGAFIIGISSGTAQAGVAEESLIAPLQIETVQTSDYSDILRKIERERRRSGPPPPPPGYHRHHRHDYYGPPPPPPGHHDRNRDYYGPPPRR